MPFILANGITIHYESAGSGVPLILIGGLGTDTSIFQLVVPKLAEHFRVFTFDLRGSGQTDKPRTAYTIVLMAQDLAELMKHLAIEKAHILGLSMGGRIAMQFAVDFPEKVNKLIIADSTMARGRKISPVIHLIKYLRGLSTKQQPYYAYKLQLAASNDFQIDCSALTMPIAIFYGLKDKYISEQSLKVMQEQIPTAEVVEFSGNHYFFLLQNEKFTEKTINFLER